ncbi:MAG: Nif3-like dinuclear metal center hexameric protein [Gemmatimonadaceae bacterium]
MATVPEITTYLDDLLGTSKVPDYPGAINGLQLANSGAVTKVAACVDFSSRAVTRAVDEKANLLLVHHGMFWGGTKPITGATYQRLRMLLDNDVAVYASHLPLDKHDRFGNNVLLSRELGLSPSGEFARYKDIAIGVRGESDIATSEILEKARRFARAHGGDAISTSHDAARRTRRWAICTGGGASADTLQEAAMSGIDTLIVGEGPHWTAVEANDLDIAIIYAGHYATETLGVFALAEHVSQQFSIDWVPIHAPTGL